MCLKVRSNQFSFYQEEYHLLLLYKLSNIYIEIEQNIDNKYFDVYWNRINNFI